MRKLSVCAAAALMAVTAFVSMPGLAAPARADSTADRPRTERDNNPSAHEGHARRCIAHVKQIAERCVEHNRQTAAKAARAIDHLLNKGQADRARHVAELAERKLTSRTDQCVARIGRRCDRCVTRLLEAGAEQQARAVRRACRAQIDRVRDSQRRALALIDAAFGR